MNIEETMGVASVIPVIEIPTIDKAAPLAEALAAGGWRSIAERCVQTNRIVMLAPSLDDDLRLHQVVEEPGVQAFGLMQQPHQVCCCP